MAKSKTNRRPAKPQIVKVKGKLEGGAHTHTEFLNTSAFYVASLVVV
jgi:hypothetical protein